MAFQLARSLRRNTVKNFMNRAQPAADEMEAEEVPHDFYIVKDYDRNPFYMSMVHSHRAGYKKIYDPFIKHSERQEHVWRPRYYGQLRDQGLGWLQMFTLIFLPIQCVLFFYWESRKRRVYEDPLAFNLGKPSEF